MTDVINGYKWELYNIAEDYSESNDLAAKMPDKLRQLQELFLVEASKYNVFPLDNSILQRIVTARPRVGMFWTALSCLALYLSANTSTLPRPPRGSARRKSREGRPSC
jgi:hypothetical protein